MAYSIDHKPSGADVFFQGDDVAAFCEEFDKLTAGTPSLPYADALTIIFQDHEALTC
ncbi:MAG: hypothetical protein HC788_04920 [Sphingopyxis sp.]|nr:hypothetical protein [Sphingopyxis sp.]